MVRVLHGVVRGKLIEVTEDLGMLDGQTVDLIVTPADPSRAQLPRVALISGPKTLPGPPPGWAPGSMPASAGLLAEEWTEEDDRILAQIHAERKNAKWRESPE
jgi:hypothetical protein